MMREMEMQSRHLAFCKRSGKQPKVSYSLLVDKHGAARRAACVSGLTSGHLYEIWQKSSDKDLRQLCLMPFHEACSPGMPTVGMA